jgi:hypothetical protein
MSRRRWVWGLSVCRSAESRVLKVSVGYMGSSLLAVIRLIERQ